MSRTRRDSNKRSLDTASTVTVAEFADGGEPFPRWDLDLIRETRDVLELLG